MTNERGGDEPISEVGGGGAPRGGATATDDDVATVRGRLCGFSGCRAALPTITGPGNRAKYCQDPAKRWGPRLLSCKEAARALELAAELAAPATLVDPSVIALGEHVDRALTPLTQLSDLLVEVRGELDRAVAAALRERDDALARAVETEGRADAATADTRAATERADQADEAAGAAHQLRIRADTDRDRAQHAQRRAELAQASAEARLTEAHDAVARADRRAGEAAENAHHLDQQLAGLRGELVAVREALEEERQRLAAETDRANHAITTAADQREQFRADHARELATLRTDHARALTEQRDHDQHAHAAELAAQRHHTEQAIERAHQQADQARRVDGETHSQQTHALHQRLGGLTHQLRGAHHALAGALASDSDADLRRRLTALLSGLEPPNNADPE